MKSLMKRIWDPGPAQVPSRPKRQWFLLLLQKHIVVMLGWFGPFGDLWSPVVVGPYIWGLIFHRCWEGRVKIQLILNV